MLTEQAHALVDQFAKVLELVGAAIMLGGRVPATAPRPFVHKGLAISVFCVSGKHRKLMRGVPIVGGMRFDVQRHRQGDRRQRCIDHHLGHDRQGLFDFAVRHFKDQFVVDLQQHLRR